MNLQIKKFRTVRNFLLLKLFLPPHQLSQENSQTQSLEKAILVFTKMLDL